MSVKRKVFSALDRLVKCNCMIMRSMFLWYLAFLPCVMEATYPGICAMDGCKCTPKAVRWVSVKCVFTKEQVNATTCPNITFCKNKILR